MKIYRTILIFSAFLLLASRVFAEDLVLYETITETKQFHMAEKNKANDVGIVTRVGDVRFTETGPVIGQFYHKVTVVHVNEKNQFDMREFTRSIQLPEGEIYTLMYFKAQPQQLVQKGDKFRGIILGGTGIYTGIRGTFDISVITPGDINSVHREVLHIQR